MSETPGDRLPPVKGIVLTHGAMCFGMVDAVRKIAGVEDDALIALSNEGRGPEELMRAVDEAAGDGSALIFTDMQMGSCAVAARFVCRDPTRRQVVFGANLPMLLDFVFHRELPLAELVDRLLERGRAAIRSLDIPEPVPSAGRTPAGR
jgi:mannose/fructose-specific phosphotransferase system component IIA